MHHISIKGFFSQKQYDEKIILTSLRDQLENYFGDRYLYEFAESADEALEVIGELHLQALEILIIVSDWLMPGMNGDEFLIHLGDAHGFHFIITVGA